MNPIHLMFLSLGLLLAGHGLQLSLLPLHGLDLGFSESDIGLTGAFYFLGFVVGCVSATRLLRRAGAIRTLMTLVTIMAGILLALEAQSSLWLWMLLRFFTGWSIAAIYATYEAWISENTEVHRLSRMFSVYVVVTLVGMAVGQSLLAIVPVEHLFTVGAILMLLAVIPVGLYCPEQQMNLEPVKLKFRRFKEVPLIALAGVGFVGMVTGCIWTLAPVAASKLGLSQAQIAMMMNAIVFGGLCFQIPLGLLADRIGHRKVVALMSCSGMLVSGVLFLSPQLSFEILLVLMFCFGGIALSLYAVSASAGQIETRLSRIDTASILLLTHGLGSVAGPIIAGALGAWSEMAMYLLSAGACCLILVVTTFSKVSVRNNVIVLEPPPAREDDASLREAA